MAPPQGPTKKLAPTISPDSGCPHDYIEYEGLQLEVDCSKCNGAHDLSNKKCLSAVMNVLTEGAQPDTIILKRFMHKRYRGEAVELASTAAGILATINRAIASTQRPSDKRCRTCPASTDQVLLTMKLALMDDPTEYVRSPMHMLAGLRMCLPRIACEQAEACFDSALNKTESRPTERT